MSQDPEIDALMGELGKRGRADILDVVVTLAVSHAVARDTKRLAWSVESLLAAFEPADVLGAALIQAGAYMRELAPLGDPQAALRERFALRHADPYDLVAFDAMLKEMRETEEPS